MFFSALLWMAAEENISEDERLRGRCVVAAANQSEVTSLTLEIKLKNLTSAGRKGELALHEGT